MESQVEGAPSFAHIHVDLAPGERLIAESDAMATMAGDLDMNARFNGGLLSGLCKKLAGGESLFVNEFVNNTDGPRRLTLGRAAPGDIREVELNGEAICLQPGAYIASTPGVNLNVGWAGFGSFIGREGLFKLKASGTGTLWYGAFGAMVDMPIDGEYIVDTGHLVAYPPEMKLRAGLSGGIFSSLFSGEGLVTRVEGRGTIVLQSRSIDGLVSWLDPHLW